MNKLFFDTDYVRARATYVDIDIDTSYEPELAYDLQNKTIAIVGNSPNLLEHEYGDLIDSHDYVVRCNHALTENYEQHVGSKTNFRIISSKVFGYEEITSLTKFTPDILLSCIDEHFIIKPRPDGDIPGHTYDNMLRHRGRNKVTIVHNEFQKTLASQLSAGEPSTGILAIEIFRKFTDHISIFGFDFYRDMGRNQQLHYFESVKHTSSIHNFRAEKALVDRLTTTTNLKLY